MPIIQADGPAVADIEKKREFVKAVTEAASTLYGLPAESVVVLLRTNAPEDVGVGGRLVADRKAEEGP